MEAYSSGFRAKLLKRCVLPASLARGAVPCHGGGEPRPAQNALTGHRGSRRDAWACWRFGFRERSASMWNSGVQVAPATLLPFPPLGPF